ncbi:MAG: ribonuclease HII [Clostridia bacterium]|nr:ribonuclease HII [Clostridia bacterium]
MTKLEREEALQNKLIEKQNFDKECLEHKGLNPAQSILGGVDEVGRGPLAGPVVTACVVLPQDCDIVGIDDSKKLSEKKREALYEEIIGKALAYGVGICDNVVIDEINILEATKLAMREAVSQCEQVLAKAGRNLDLILFDAMEIKEIEIPQMAIIKGDAQSLSIGAASIVAKVVRDRMMVDYSKEYPHYAFESNKGYGTKAHYQGIKEYGITPIHRKSYLKNLQEHF